MPGRVEPSTALTELTPRRIVEELDRFIVGQAAAKRAVAIALRTRARRLRLSPELADEVVPKNILMIGPTGVGKTEIARRLARLAGAPFLKVEASKFTEVGYVGRDVESMVRDMLEIAVDLVRAEWRQQVGSAARRAAEARLLDALLPPRPSAAGEDGASQLESWKRSRETLRRQLAAGELDERTVELDVPTSSQAGFKMFGAAGMEEMNLNLGEMMPGLFQGRTSRRRLTVAEAREHLEREEQDNRIDQERLSQEAIQRVEQAGILFIDEIDKVAGREGPQGPDVSREGVQRDLLPIVEGTLVNTKYGMVRTDHILFIAAGAFHVSKPSDLIPELQGRFPIRVELDSLGRDELVRILTEPEHSLVKQYRSLLAIEGLELDFTEDGVAAIAEIAEQVNRTHENIGARRLHTMMEFLLEELSFDGAEHPDKRVVIDAGYVRRRLQPVLGDSDLSQYIL